MSEQRKVLIDLFKNIGALAAYLSAFATNLVQIRQAIVGEPHWLWLAVSVALTVAVCVFVLTKKTTVGARFGQETRIPLFKPWSRLASKVVLGLVVLFLALLPLLRIRETNAFTVFVADIDGPPNSQHRVTESLVEDLRKATEAYPDIRIAALGQRVSVQEGRVVARTLGKKKNADIVIWGWYDVSAAKVRVTLHCEVLAADIRPIKDRVDTTGIYAISQFESFDVQKNLGADVSALALLFVGNSKLVRKDYDGAHKVLTDALGHVRNQDSFGEAADIYCARAHCYMGERTLAYSRLAVEDFTSAIMLRTNHTEAYVNRASAYLGLRNPSAALADCDHALQIEPGHPVALANRSVALIELGRLDDAVRDAEAACAAVPSFHLYRLTLAQALAAKGETDEAILECNAILKLELANSTALLVRASSLRLGHRLEEAIREFTALLRYPGMQAQAYYGRGNSYWDKGDFTKAVDDFTACLRYWTNSANVYALRAQMYQALGQYRQAIADCDFAIAASSNLVDVPLPNVLCLRGQAYTDLGIFSAATTNFSAAIQLSPQFVRAYEGRARALMTQRDFTNALEDLSKILDVETNSASVFYNRGMVYLQLNMLSNAVANFSRSLSLDTNFAESFCFRGVAYVGLNLHSNAITDLSASIRRNPTNFFAHAVRGMSYWALGEMSDAFRDCRVSMRETNEPVTMQNTATLWSAILEIWQNPTNSENLRALNRQPSAEHKQVEELLIGVRGGRLADYERLGELAKGTNGLLAQAAIKDALTYFDTYRDRMFLKRKFFMDPAMLNLMPLSVDEVVFNQLRSSTWLDREAAVFYLAETRKPSVVPHLCDALLSETNLYVVSDITKALNELTGTDHGPLATKQVKDWWSSHNRDKAYQTPFAASQRYWNLLTMSADQSKEALGALSQTIDAEPAAYWTRCFRAGCYIVLHEFDLAEKDLTAVEQASPRLSWLLFYRTILHYASGKPEQAKSLNELLSRYPNFEANIRQLLPTNVIADSRIRWPSTSVEKQN